MISAPLVVVGVTAEPFFMTEILPAWNTAISLMLIPWAS
jgi:hypothetical protein